MRGWQGQNLLRPERKRKPYTRAVLFLLGLLLLGSAIPHWKASKLFGPSGVPADGILVPAGGEYRITAGFRAWKEGRGKHLFILGAGREATPERILPGWPELTDEERSRIHIESWSENTFENAVSARMEVSEYRLGKVILVTSDYHVARAYLALRTILPETVSIEVVPVLPGGGGRSSWWRYPLLYFTEGWKYWGYRLFLRWN